MYFCTAQDWIYKPYYFIAIYILLQFCINIQNYPFYIFHFKFCLFFIFVLFLFRFNLFQFLLQFLLPVSNFSVSKTHCFKVITSSQELKLYFCLFLKQHFQFSFKCLFYLNFISIIDLLLVLYYDNNPDLNTMNI